MHRKAVTAQNVADNLGVSLLSVYRALNGLSGVSPKTADKVRAAAREMGYAPNRAARHLSKRTKCTIGISYYLPDWFARQILEGCEQAFTELTSLGLSTIIKGESESYEAQISQIRELASSCDALALSVYEPQYFESLIDELADAGIPVATFNVDVPTSKRLFYIGCNYIESGKLCGELVAKLTGRRPGKVAIVTKKQSISILEQRIVGFRTVVAHEPFLEIVGPIKLTESPSDDEAQISDLLAANPDIAGIYVANQSLSAAARAVRRAGRQGSVVLVGHDLNDEHCALIADGAVDAVVCQEPFYQGYYPVKILLDYVIDRIMPPTREVFTRLEIVMKENLKYYATSHQAFINRPAQMT
ncbi:MAG: LacI family DNA-binding transcriptional regulator [Spirochaetia bacterium]